VVAGILVGERLGPGRAQLPLVFGALALGLSWFVASRARVAVAAIALAMLGCAATRRALDGQAHSHLTAGIAARATVDAIGVVAGDPDSGPFVASVIVRVRTQHGATPRLLAAHATGDAAARLRVLHAGDRVELRGRLGPLRATRFDEPLRWRHVVGRLDNADVLALRPARGLFALADRVREVVVRGTRPLPPTPRALLLGFLLGDTRAVPDDVTDAYRAAGLSHLLAVSGANVAFALALIAPALRRLRLGARTGVALSVVVVFAAMTRFEPSVLRASAMATVALASSLLGRPASTTRRLLLAVIALLLVDPFLLHSMGFALSAAASAGIALTAAPVSRRLPGPRWCAESLAVSIAAQLGVTPILLVLFGSVPLVAPLTNLLAAPAASALGAYGLLASTVTGLVPGVGPLVQQPSLVLVAWVSRVARFGAAMPLEVDRRGACAIVAIGALGWAASLACTRVRRAVPEDPPR
jgi:competence protein ComEC